MDRYNYKDYEEALDTEEEYRSYLKNQEYRRDQEYFVEDVDSDDERYAKVDPSGFSSVIDVHDPIHAVKKGRRKRKEELQATIPQQTTHIGGPNQLNAEGRRAMYAALHAAGPSHARGELNRRGVDRGQRYNFSKLDLGDVVDAGVVQLGKITRRVTFTKGVGPSFTQPRVSEPGRKKVELRGLLKRFLNHPTSAIWEFSQKRQTAVRVSGERLETLVSSGWRICDYGDTDLRDPNVLFVVNGDYGVFEELSHSEYGWKAKLKNGFYTLRHVDTPLVASDLNGNNGEWTNGDDVVAKVCENPKGCMLKKHYHKQAKGGNKKPYTGAERRYNEKVMVCKKAGVYECMMPIDECRLIKEDDHYHLFSSKIPENAPTGDDVAEIPVSPLASLTSEEGPKIHPSAPPDTDFLLEATNVLATLPPLTRREKQKLHKRQKHEKAQALAKVDRELAKLARESAAVSGKAVVEANPPPKPPPDIPQKNGTQKAIVTDPTPAIVLKIAQPRGLPAEKESVNRNEEESVAFSKSPTEVEYATEISRDAQDPEPSAPPLPVMVRMPDPIPTKVKPERRMDPEQPPVPRNPPGPPGGGGPLPPIPGGGGGGSDDGWDSDTESEVSSLTSETAESTDDDSDSKKKQPKMRMGPPGSNLQASSVGTDNYLPWVEFVAEEPPAPFQMEDTLVNVILFVNCGEPTGTPTTLFNDFCLRIKEFYRGIFYTHKVKLLDEDDIFGDSALKRRFAYHSIERNQVLYGGEEHTPHWWTRLFGGRKFRVCKKHEVDLFEGGYRYSVRAHIFDALATYLLGTVGTLSVGSLGGEGNVGTWLPSRILQDVKNKDMTYLHPKNFAHTMSTVIYVMNELYLAQMQKCQALPLRSICKLSPTTKYSSFPVQVASDFRS